MNKYVKSLKEAKKLLVVRGEDDTDHFKSSFICIALRSVAQRNDDLEPYCYRIISYITDCMGGSGCSLENWLEINGHIKDYSYNDDFARKMYEYRLEWIDELIRLYKGKKNDQ